MKKPTQLTAEEWRALAEQHKATSANWAVWDAPGMAKLYADEAAACEANAAALEEREAKAKP